MSKNETPLGQVKALDRYLSPIDVWAIAFGCMHIAKPIDVDVLMKTLTDVLLASEKT
jgi:hypothetical protein